MLPPPSVGGIEFSSGAVSDGAVVCATPIVPMNGRSGNTTSRSPNVMNPTAVPSGAARTRVNTDRLP